MPVHPSRLTATVAALVLSILLLGQTLSAPAQAHPAAPIFVTLPILA